MSSDKDKAKLYAQFFCSKITPNLNITARMSWSNVYNRFWSHSKNSQSCTCIIMFKNLRQRLLLVFETVHQAKTAGQQLGFMAVQGVRTFQTFSHAINSLLLHLMK